METPCERSHELGEESGGARVFLKRDHLQATGSFKERGAANALLVLGREARAGVVAASAGNHALGLARHGARLGVPVTLVMPRGAAQAKVARCRQLGAEIVLEGGSFDEAEAFARDLARGRGAAFVHPFDDKSVMAGQGTMALEILKQVPEVEAIVVPVGGGGLLAGVVAAVGALRPEVQIHAVEPAAAACFAAARQSGRPVRVAVNATFADGLAVARAGRRAFASSEGHVAGSCTVSEEEIAWAMLRLFEVERTAVEGAGATALAALLAGKLSALEGRNVVVPVCGANVDATTFARALDLALARRQRLALDVAAV
ncbi:MAG: pyridoxal-phosphate dependent enzyme [Burkholderiales bacterium]